MVKKRDPVIQAGVTRLITICRKLYQHKPHSLLFAIKALQLAKEHKLRKPRWAQNALEDCFPAILGIATKEDHGSMLMKAMHIVGRDFGKYEEEIYSFAAAIDLMTMCGDGVDVDGIRVTEVYRQLSRRYPTLGTPDVLRKKLPPFLTIIQNGELFPDPFSS